MYENGLESASNTVTASPCMSRDNQSGPGRPPRHPAWYYNLVAHSDIEFEMSGRRRELRARLVVGEERAELWPVCVKRWAGYEGYSKRTTREIPVFLCEPR